MKKPLYIISLLFVVLCSCNKTSPKKFVDGIIEVPENRNDPNSRTIKLVYKVLKAKNPDSTKAPVVFLQGGPGAPTLISEEFWTNHPLLNDRDIVLMDQRGTGGSQANCVEMGKSIFEIMRQDLDVEEDVKATRLLMNQCKKTLEQKGVDLAGYNSKENAADFEDLRIALGYEKWNLYGASYGSRLGLTIMRDFPKSVRSAILSGILPPESNMYSDRIGSFDKSLQKVFKSCEEDESCNSRFPALRERLPKVLAKLLVEPLRIEYDGKPFVINSQEAFSLLFLLLYDKPSIGQIPNFIEALESRKVEPLKAYLRHFEFFISILNLPMGYSVNAYEDLPFYDQSDLDRAIKQSEFSYLHTLVPMAVKLLTDWHPYRAPNKERRPVVSNIPTLMISGSLDHVTPPSNATKALQHLTNGQEVIFQNEGHNFTNPCLFKITEAFINDPFQQIKIDCSVDAQPIEWNLSN